MDIRSNYTETIIQLMRQSVADGSPVNPPIWWIDPTDPVAHYIYDGKQIRFKSSIFTFGQIRVGLIEKS